MELSNNSNEMNTVVETFYVEETVGLIYDNEELGRWSEIVNDLGLVGQSEIVFDEKSPIPFLFMNNSMMQVYHELCPRIVDIADFDISPIPIKILETVALSVREKYFNEISIWYDDKTQNPVCVGLTCEYYGFNDAYDRTINFKTRGEADDVSEKRGSHRTNEKRYLIGKWGDVNRSFEELKEMATKRHIDDKTNEYKKQIKEAQRGIYDLESEAYNKFN